MGFRDWRDLGLQLKNFLGFKVRASGLAGFRVRALEILRISGLRVRPLGMLGV